MIATKESGPADRSRAPGNRHLARWLITGGLAVLSVAVIWYLFENRPNLMALPLDLSVYRDAGLIVRHVAPLYHAARAGPLYGSLGPGAHGLTFTYPPFAALPFALLSFLSLRALGWVFALADLVAVPLTIWITVRELGVPRGRLRSGLTVLTTVAALMTEPVLRAIGLGQVEILLMVLILWDLCQPDRRWWKGAGVGLAAGIKLVPLIFIGYLLLTRRFMQAAVAAATFAATVVIGFIALPRDSSQWWLHGLFVHESYGGNMRYAGNQSIMAIIVRAGSHDWHALWLAAAIVTGVLGLAAAAVIDRAGERLLGLATCALTALLISPISWDHHWVWIVIAAPVLVHRALQARGLARRIWLGTAVLVAAVFGAWPTSLWGEIYDRYGWNLGVIWAPPNGANSETGWHGLQLIVGNAFVLTGLALFVLLVASAPALYRRAIRHGRPVIDLPPGPSGVIASGLG
jgi:alpha-1,2-mannosyltransferase